MQMYHRRNKHLHAPAVLVLACNYRNDRIELLYFRTPPAAAGLSKSSRDRVLQDIDISTQETKLARFAAVANDLVDEMKMAHSMSSITVYQVSTVEFICQSCHPIFISATDIEEDHYCCFLFRASSDISRSSSV